MTTSRITGAAWEAAVDVAMDDGHNGLDCRPTRNFGQTMRAALEAAEPHMAPVVDREALAKVLSAHELKGGPGFYEGQYRTQFFCECGAAIYQDRHTGETRDEGHRAHVADAVLALINGSAK